MTRTLFDLSTTTYVYGIKPPDEKWRRMRAVWDACVEAGVGPPNEVEVFFGHEPPSATDGVVIDLEKIGAAKLWQPGGDSMKEGVEVLVDLVPQDVAIIRFVNSY